MSTDQVVLSLLSADLLIRLRLKLAVKLRREPSSDSKISTNPAIPFRAKYALAGSDDGAY
jgi:hypothetical protein